MSPGLSESSFSSPSIEQLTQENAKLRAEGQQIAFSALDRILEITTRIFGTNVSVKSTCDPEFPSDKYIVFTVEATGDIAEIHDKQRQWLDQTREIAKDWRSFTLAIDVK